MKPFLSCLLFSIFYCQFSAIAELSPRDFDLNGDNLLSFDEALNFTLRKESPEWNLLDQNEDNEISKTEKEDWFRKYYWVDAVPDLESGFAEPDINSKVTFQRIESIFPPRPPSFQTIKGLDDTKSGLGKLRFGESHDDLSVPVKKSNPGSLGFFRDQEAGEETWTTTASIGLDRVIFDPEDPFTFGRFVADPLRLLPSLTIDRVSGGGGGSVSEVDSLVARSGFSWSFQNDQGGGLMNSFYINANYRAAGQTDGASFSHGFEFDFAPVIEKESFSIGGGFRPLNPKFNLTPERALITYNLPLLIRAETAESCPCQDGSFAKLGPVLGIQLQSPRVPRVGLFANYSYLWEVVNSSRDFSLLELGSRVSLDKADQLFLEFKYRYGQVPAQYTDIDLFQTSLGVRF